MFKNWRFILIIAVILVALVVGGWWWYAKNRVVAPPSQAPPSVGADEQPVGPTDDFIQDELNKQVAGKTEAEISTQAEIMSVGRYFIERYGSFSNQAGWQNLKDVKVVATSDLQQEFDNLIGKVPNAGGDEFYSLTTKVLNLRLVSQTQSQAGLEANTQKQEKSGGASRIFYQTVTVDLVKAGEQWLVSDFDFKD